MNQGYYGYRYRNYISYLEGDDQIPNKGAWDAALDAAGKDISNGNFDIKKISIGAAIAAGSAIAQAVIPIPLVGAAVGAIIGSIAGLIGVRGATQHLSPAEADKAARTVTDKLLEMYRSLPQDGKDFMLKAAQNFNRAMLADFGTWWGNMDLAPGENPNEGFLTRFMKAEQLKGHLSTPESAFYVLINAPMYVVLRAADMESVKDNFQSWVIQPKLVPLVLEPTKKFVEQRFKQVVEYNQQGQITTPPPAAPPPPTSQHMTTASVFGNNTGIALLIGGGLLVAALMSDSRKEHS